MASTFAGIEIAKTGVYISQAAINVTGHNIANADTAGYTRQRIDLAAIDPYGVLTRLAPLDTTIYGGGVTSLQVIQIRNQFLDRQFREQNTELNYWSTKASSMAFVEKLFDSTQDNEIQKTMEALYNSFTKLSEQPGNQGYRANVVSAAQTLAQSLNAAYNNLVAQRETENQAVALNVTQINQKASSIADLNVQIYKFEQTGQPANDLRDQRNLLLDELSSIVDITYSEDGNGKLSVYIGGETLVSHKDYNELSTTTDADGIHTVVWDASQSPVTIKSGEIKAHLDWRDGATNDDYGLPYLMSQLDMLADALVTEINALHSTGYTHDNSSLGVTTGIDFFVMGTPPGAGSIAVNPDIEKDEWLIAASSIADPAKEGNNEIALQLAELLNKTKVSGLSDSFGNYLQGIMSVLGSKTQYVNGKASSTFIMASALDNQRMEVSGVSLDEEMTNLIKFQHAYSAAARALTAMDEALDVLINRTGRVGL